MRKAVFLVACQFAVGLGWFSLASAQTGGSQSVAAGPEASDVVVTAVRDVVVNGRARHCYPRPGDPLDKVNVNSDLGRTGQSAIVPAGEAGFALEPNAEQMTGPDYWQRVGRSIEYYVFRGSFHGGPMCVGGSMPDPNTYGGYRRILDAGPYRGKRIRFTLWVATGQARSVHFWLAAGIGERKLYNGGNTNNRPWGGNHGWTPVLLETGPVAEKAEHISYGFNLEGPGDVWVYKPKLEIITDEPLGAPAGDLIVIGSDKQYLPSQ
jgi:hypothetical protein